MKFGEELKLFLLRDFLHLPLPFS